MFRLFIVFVSRATCFFFVLFFFLLCVYSFSCFSFLFLFFLCFSFSCYCFICLSFFFFLSVLDILLVLVLLVLAIVFFSSSHLYYYYYYYCCFINFSIIIIVNIVIISIIVFITLTVIIIHAKLQSWCSQHHSSPPRPNTVFRPEHCGRGIIQVSVPATVRCRSILHDGVWCGITIRAGVEGSRVEGSMSECSAAPRVLAWGGLVDMLCRGECC